MRYYSLLTYIVQSEHFFPFLLDFDKKWGGKDAVKGVFTNRRRKLQGTPEVPVNVDESDSEPGYDPSPAPAAQIATVATSSNDKGKGKEPEDVEEDPESSPDNNDFDDALNVAMIDDSNLADAFPPGSPIPDRTTISTLNFNNRIPAPALNVPGPSSAAPRSRRSSQVSSSRRPSSSVQPAHVPSSLNPPSDPALRPLSRHQSFSSHPPPALSATEHASLVNLAAGNGQFKDAAELERYIAGLRASFGNGGADADADAEMRDAAAIEDDEVSEEEADTAVAAGRVAMEVEAYSALASLPDLDTYEQESSDHDNIPLIDLPPPRKQASKQAGTSKPIPAKKSTTKKPTTTKGKGKKNAAAPTDVDSGAMDVDPTPALPTVVPPAPARVGRPPRKTAQPSTAAAAAAPSPALLAPPVAESASGGRARSASASRAAARPTPMGQRPPSRSSARVQSRASSRAGSAVDAEEPAN